MTGSTVPLGQLESQTLEFKSAREIENLAKSKSDLGRSVTAMLNAEGGEIWIGIAEREARAMEIESISNPTAGSDSAWNHLLNTIDPRVSPGEISIEPITIESSTILRIAVPRGSRKPYAFTRHGSRYYIRVGRRIRDMTREELVEASRGVSAADADVALLGARETLEKRRVDLENKSEPVFWIGLRAVFSGAGRAKLQFDLDTVQSGRFLVDPKTTGSRVGSVIATDRLTPMVRDGWTSIGRDGWGWITVGKDGSVEQRFPLDRLWDRGHADGSGANRRLIQPIAWIENLTFPLRLMGALLKQCSVRQAGSRVQKLTGDEMNHVEVAVSVAMIQALGVRLRPHSPDAVGYLWPDAERVLPTEGQHWHLDDALTGVDLVENPDRCAYRLTKRFYDEFDFPSLLTRGDPIPRQFDRVTGRLVLPE